MDGRVGGREAADQGLGGVPVEDPQRHDRVLIGFDDRAVAGLFTVVMKGVEDREAILFGQPAGKRIRPEGPGGLACRRGRRRPPGDRRLDAARAVVLRRRRRPGAAGDLPGTFSMQSI